MGTLIRKSRALAWIVIAVVFVMWLPAGCTPATTHAGGGQATSMGQSSADLGQAGTIEVTDGQQAQSEGEALVTGDAPADATTGSVSVAPSNVQFISAGGGAAGQEVPSGGREAQVTVHIAGSDATDVCAPEFTVLDFTATEAADGTISLTGDASATLQGEDIQLATSDSFAICIQVVANFNGTVVVSAVDIEAGTDDDDMGSDGDDDMGSDGDDDDMGSDGDDDDMSTDGDDLSADGPDDMSSDGTDDMGSDGADDMGTGGTDDMGTGGTDDSLSTNGTDASTNGNDTSPAV
ncbi:MAG: hypothetical protein ACE5GE_06610 [Phycisphaerae bacterium]